eukprot:438745-Alexandrium_andersonii.AAC.1
MCVWEDAHRERANMDHLPCGCEAREGGPSGGAHLHLDEGSVGFRGRVQCYDRRSGDRLG